METIMLNASMIRTFGKKVVMLLLVSTLIVSAAGAAISDSSIEDSATVSCLRVEDGQVFFTVKYGNETGERFDILVNDAGGDNLYRGSFSGKNFNKVFRAPVEAGKLVILIRTPKDKTDHKFELISEAKMIAQTYVKRL